MVIDHIGVVVSDLSTAIEHWVTVFGYEQMTEMVANTRQKVKVVFLTKKDSIAVKLVEPTEKSSPIYRLASRGGGFHHLCFKCDDVEGEIDRLKELGLRVLTDPQPGEAFENRNIAFVYAQSMNLNIELIDTDLKANRLKNNG